MFKLLTIIPPDTKIRFMNFARPAFAVSTAVALAFAMFVASEAYKLIDFYDDKPLVHILTQSSETSDVLSSDAKTIEFYEDWFSRQLYAMGEPLFWKPSKREPDARIYRLLIIPTFTAAHAVRIRIEQNGTGNAHVTLLNGKGGYYPGGVEARRTVDVRSEQIRSLVALFQKSGYWSGGTGELKRTDIQETRICFDGVRYALEALADRKYKLVTRHMCSIEEDVRTIINALADIAGFERAPKFPW